MASPYENSVVFDTSGVDELIELTKNYPQAKKGEGIILKESDDKINLFIENAHHYVSIVDMLNMKAGIETSAPGKYENGIFSDEWLQEINDVFGSKLNEKSGLICVIDASADKTNEEKRYTWIQGGSILDFEKTTTADAVGTFKVYENNSNTPVIVQVKGFDDNGNFTTNGKITGEEFSKINIEDQTDALRYGLDSDTTPIETLIPVPDGTVENLSTPEFIIYNSGDFVGTMDGEWHAKVKEDNSHQRWLKIINGVVDNKCDLTKNYYYFKYTNNEKNFYTVNGDYDTTNTNNPYISGDSWTTHSTEGLEEHWNVKSPYNYGEAEKPNDNFIILYPIQGINAAIYYQIDFYLFLYKHDYWQDGANSGWQETYTGVDVYDCGAQAAAWAGGYYSPDQTLRTYEVIPITDITNFTRNPLTLSTEEYWYYPNNDTTQVPKKLDRKNLPAGNTQLYTKIIASAGLTDPAYGWIYNTTKKLSNSVEIPSEYPLTLVGSFTTKGGISVGKHVKAYRFQGSFQNDYAEYRFVSKLPAGSCVVELGNGGMVASTERLQPGANVISDTYGFIIGESVLAKTPIAVCGRVLAYPYEDRNSYQPGDAVCSGPNGTISKMTREEIREWPDRIVGYVSEIPTYQYWGDDNVEVNGRIWIKVH